MKHFDFPPTLSGTLLLAVTSLKNGLAQFNQRRGTHTHIQRERDTHTRTHTHTHTFDVVKIVYVAIHIQLTLCV